MYSDLMVYIVNATKAGLLCYHSSLFLVFLFGWVGGGGVVGYIKQYFTDPCTITCTACTIILVLSLTIQKTG